MITRKVAPALAVGCTVVVKPARRDALPALALGRTGPARRLPKACSTSSPAIAPAIGGDLRPTRSAQGLLHRLDRGRQAADGQCGAHGEEDLARAGRQRAVHRLRRRRSRRRRRGRDGLQVPQQRARPASAPTACSCRTGSTTHSQPSWPRRCGAARSAHGTEAGVTQGPLIDERRSTRWRSMSPTPLAKGPRCSLGGKRHARGGTFFEPTVLADALPGMKHRPRGNLRPGRAAVPFQERGRSDRLANAPSTGSRPTSTPRHRPRLARGRGARLRHGRRQLRPHHHGSCALRRRQESGLGREGSKYGCEEFIEVKYICMGGLDR